MFLIFNWISNWGPWYFKGLFNGLKRKSVYNIYQKNGENENLKKRLFKGCEALDKTQPQKQPPRRKEERRTGKREEEGRRGKKEKRSKEEEAEERKQTFLRFLASRVQRFSFLPIWFAGCSKLRNPVAVTSACWALKSLTASHTISRMCTVGRC